MVDPADQQAPGHQPGDQERLAVGPGADRHLARRAGRNDAPVRGHGHGRFRQISRLGNPLINEVVIPREKKDYWNGQTPKHDSQFAKYYKAPELTAVANVLYSALDPRVRLTESKG